MITFNQLKYNTFCYTMGQVPWIRLILFFIFLTVSSLLYYLSISMHESTIFRITGRVDFLNMPILDTIENKTQEWWHKEVDSVDAAKKDVVRKIMKDHFIQQTPLYIKKYADMNGIRAEFNEGSKLHTALEHGSALLQYINYHKQKYGVQMANYGFLRNHGDKIPNTIKHRLIIYDEQFFNIDDTGNGTDKLAKMDPLKHLFDPVKIKYGEAITPFYTMTLKQNAQKLICNIGSGETAEKKTGNLYMSILNPLFMRYMFINEHYTNQYESWSDLDLFSTKNGYGRFTNFDYERTTQVEILPGDWFYLPSNWWMQLHFRMLEKPDGDSEPRYERFDPDDKFETDVKWVEFHYTSNSILEDIAFNGLEEGFGS